MSRVMKTTATNEGERVGNAQDEQEKDAPGMAGRQSSRQAVTQSGPGCSGCYHAPPASGFYMLRVRHVGQWIGSPNIPNIAEGLANTRTHFKFRQ